MGRRPFLKLYLSQFSFKTGLRKIEHWIKGYLIKSSIFVWFSITWASWKQNYQGKLFICLNIMWVPYRFKKNKPKVNWKKQGSISILVVTLDSNSITVFQQKFTIKIRICERHSTRHPFRQFQCRVDPYLVTNYSQPFLMNRMKPCFEKKNSSFFLVSCKTRILFPPAGAAPPGGGGAAAGARRPGYFAT